MRRNSRHPDSYIEEAMNLAGRYAAFLCGPQRCHTDHYWQVYFDGNRVIKEALAAAGFPAPMPAQLVVVNQH
jgi:hypothetical protein